jgi:DNA-directed RNA polymerase subunit RPC12/RpoP
MITIKAEGTEYLYVPATSNPKLVDVKFEVPMTVVEQLIQGADTRLALFKNMLPPHSLVPYWLVWQENKDLQMLDHRVLNGLSTDQDFTNAFRTVPQLTRCFTCGQTYRTLVIDAGDPYPGAPALRREKISKVKTLPCPLCGSSLRQIVVKIVSMYSQSS